MLIAPIRPAKENQPYDFLSQVLPATGNYWMLLRRKIGATHFEHESFSDIESMSSRISWLDSHGFDVWHGMGSFKHKHSEVADEGDGKTWGRRAENVSHLASFWLDIDVSADKPNTYRCIEEAEAALDAFASRIGIPPNWIVHSGMGIHAYWIVDEDVPRDKWRLIANKLKHVTRVTGLLADPARTSDVTSVLRPVGTLSKKRSASVLGRWNRFGHIPLASFEAAMDNVLSQEGQDSRTGSDGISKPSTTQAVELDDARWFESLSVDKRPDALREMLTFLPETCADDYDTWIRIGAALRCTPGLTLEALFSIWADWSKGSSKWDATQESQYHEKWLGFDRSGIGALIVLAKRFGWRRPEGDAALTEDGRIASLEEARRMIAEQFAYARLENKFVSRDGATLSVEAFDRSLARRMPLDNNGRPISAVHIAIRYGAAAIVDVAGYAPGRAFIYEDSGTKQRMANTYQAPEQDELEPTDLERRALAAFRKHLIAGDPDTEKMLHYFDQALAYLVQHPTERIPKVFLLIGEKQGSGKSTFTLGFTRALFGWQNVGKVTNSEIRSSFNEWMTNRRIVCLEEIWMTDRKDARDLVNSLKDNITDAIARIHPKGGKGFQMTNPATYYASSNHLDAVDLAAGDRRWAIAHTKAGPIDERFARWLHQWLQPDGRGPRVLRYVYRRISLEGFNPHGAVPISNAKTNLVELSRTDIERVVYDSWHACQGPFATDITTLEDICAFVTQQLGYTASRKQILLALQSGEIEVTQLRAKKERAGRTQIKRLWITRNHPRYAECGPAELFEEYEKSRLQSVARVVKLADRHTAANQGEEGAK